ncbi:hypothetical protein HYW75_05780 [Candidatus Pacearchaeota archaeon]|nr:hypothetical protein [Candidatus Pacearchaeota archaeon]
MENNTTDFVMSWFYGILLLILLIFFTNIISYTFPNSVTIDISHFLNDNIIILIIISFLFFLGSLFYHIGFPANLAFPILDGFGSAVLINFIIKIIVLLEKNLPSNLGPALERNTGIFSFVIFFIIIIFGYISIIKNFNNRKEHGEVEEITEETIEDEEQPPHIKKTTTKRITRK